MDQDTLARVERWNDILDASSYYEILGILEIADGAAIRDAFHRFAESFHPDAHSGDPETQRLVSRVFQRGAEAYRVLSRPELRTRYDLALAKGQLRLVAGSAPPTGPEERRVRSLDELCRTAGGRRCAERADELIGRGDLAEAKRHLQLALQHEGGDNADLAERIDALDLALFAMGK